MKHTREETVIADHWMFRTLL